jgi:hypothetical protein
VEAAAQGYAEEWRRDLGENLKRDVPTWAEMSEPQREAMRRCTRAALEDAEAAAWQRIKGGRPTMKVKLTSREPTQEMQNHGSVSRYNNLGTCSDMYSNMHDAAPDDATKALEFTVQMLNRIAQWIDGSVGSHMDEPSSARQARKALERLRATEVGAVLIQQAEERDDGIGS